MSITGSNGIAGYGSQREMMKAMDGPSPDDPRAQIPSEGKYVPLYKRLNNQKASSKEKEADPFTHLNVGKQD